MVNDYKSKLLCFYKVNFKIRFKEWAFVFFIVGGVMVVVGIIFN